jgi:hypothetical protein
MAETKPGKKGTQQSARRTTGKASEGFTDEERAAMKERAEELKAEHGCSRDRTHVCSLGAMPYRKSSRFNCPAELLRTRLPSSSLPGEGCTEA